MSHFFSKTHSAAILLDGLNADQFLAIACDAIQKLGLEPAYISLHHVVYYSRVRRNGDSEVLNISIEGDRATITSKAFGGRLISLGKNKKNIDEFRVAFSEVKSSLSPDELTEKCRELTLRLSPDDPDAYSKYLHGGGLGGFWGIFIPNKNSFITPLIIDINVFVFIIMCIAGVSFIAPATGDLLQWGGDFRPYTIHGGWWRMFTSMFVHAGVIHLLMNMYALLYIGVLLEPLLGKTRFAAAYLLSGICSGLLSIAIHPFTVSVGASGAIFGIYGVFLAMLTTNLIEKSARKAMLQSILIFVGYNLVAGMKGNIDNAGHIGGLLSGLLIGYTFYFELRKGKEARSPVKNIGLMTTAVVALTVFTFITLPDPATEYQKTVEKFSENEEKALKVYSLDDSASRDTVLHYLAEGMKYWAQNQKLADKMLALDLPDGIQHRNRLLKQYSLLRADVYELGYKQVEENDTAYADKINEYNEKIQSLLDQLKE